MLKVLFIIAPVRLLLMSSTKQRHKDQQNSMFPELPEILGEVALWKTMELLMGNFTKKFGNN